MIGRIIFFMGRSASGKSTISKALCNELRSKNHSCVVVDADDLAANKLMPLLGDFSLKARLERAPYLVKIVTWLQSQFDFVIVAATGQPPEAREIFKKNFSNYTSIYLSATLAQCKERDYKGIYQLKSVPGIDLPFAEPLDCDHIIEVKNLSPNEIVQTVERLIS